MAGGMRTGFLIAALVAAAFLGFSFFGTRHENWFLRAAQENAVRCLTKSPCTSLTAQSGIVPNARPPLSYASACAKPGDWQQLKSVSNDKTRIVLTCTDKMTFLYHMGTLPGRDAGIEQWTVCEDRSCAQAAKALLPMR